MLLRSLLLPVVLAAPTMLESAASLKLGERSVQVSRDVDAAAAAYAPSHVNAGEGEDAPSSLARRADPCPPATQHKFPAPHNAIYVMESFDGRFPTVEELGKFNRLILAFFMTTGDLGYEDSPVVGQWVNMDHGERQALLDSYHAAGIAVMLAVFGGLDQPTVWNVDPNLFAGEVSDFVRLQQLDGVDVDYEDFAAFAQGRAAVWINSFQNALRSKLGDEYLISHAPISPWFYGAGYSDGAYQTVWKETGHGIDFFNLQYYNQGGGYTDCKSLIHDASGTPWKGTSIKEIHDFGVPWEKLVVGKPTVPEASKGGFMEPAELAKCLNEGAQLGWTKQVMYWEWAPTYINKIDLGNTVLGG